MKYKFLNNEDIYMEIKDGLIYAKFKGNRIDKNLAERVIGTRLAFMEGQVLPAIVDISLVKDVTKEAREVLSSKKAGKNIAASAVIVKNPVTRTIANFFFRFQQPNYPFRLFTDSEQAREWAKKY